LVKKLALVVEGMPDKELDLTGDLKTLKEQKFKIKEGVPYKIRIDFIVQREIVHGLKYIQKTSRKGITGKSRLRIFMREALGFNEWIKSKDT
jgi:Rho GDP-dissociation inhibitor